MKEFLVVGNLKSNMLVKDISNYLNKMKVIEDKNVVIFPAAIYIPYFLKNGYSVGSQTVFFKEGSYTGEISPMQLASMGIDYVMIGHSDRRIYFNETDSDINKKILECLKYNLKIILCVGETNEDKNMLRTTRVLKKQITYALRNVDNFDNIIIAYEPVWAIGTNITPSINDIKSACLYIKEIVEKQFKKDNIKVLYGGSVTSKNINEINQIEELSGVLVGMSATDPDEFIDIINNVKL